jgi:hypothetical protein
VTVDRKKDVQTARRFSDYDVTIDKAAIPAGVTVTVKE